MPLNPDDTLLNGQYRILGLLGRGGFGFVYQARDTLIHREVAIKELIPALVDEPTLKRFLVEARATLELAHESIVRTYNVFQEDGNYYIVMECMAGGSLEERLREGGALPVDEAVRIAAEVCAGLDHAHRRGIVHCDLKPANILFASSGAAKVADFGIAHVSGEMLTRSWMTPAGFVAGTLPYMSPEQADGVRDDPRVDVYALGAVIYRMLTGRTYLDFDQRETPGAQADNVLRIRNAEPVPPSAHNRRIPEWLDGLVLKALSKRPEERYRSAAEVQSALEGKGAAAPALPPVETKPAPTQARPHPSHRPAWFWPAVGAAGVLLVAIAVALALLLRGGTGGADTRTPETTQVAMVEPTVTSTLAPTRTALPPTSTPAPTSTPVPTATVRPTASQTPVPMPVPPTSTHGPTITPTVITPTPQPTNISAKTGGDRIVFQSKEQDGTWDIYIVNGDGSSLRRLTDHPGDDYGPSWSPDGRQIAFSSNRDGNDEVYTVNADGSNLKNLTNHQASDLSLSWSPDGSRITFSSNRDGNREIYSVNVDGSDLRNLTNHKGSDVGGSWSPDGSRIAFTSYRDGNAEVYSVGVDGTNPINLTNHPAIDSAGSWSPDGRRIAFLSTRDGNRWLYLMNADGSGVRRLSNELDWPVGFSWSPDGTRIACIRGASLWNLYVVNVDDGVFRRLTDDPASEGALSWSPDGTHIAFSSEHHDMPHDFYGREIYTIRVDGTGLTNLTNSTGVDDDYPSWSP